MNYLIIDDEPIAHRIIEGYCDKISYLEKVGNAYDAFEALEVIHEGNIDLLFLDINMPKMTGFEFLRSIPNAPHVIVTSAYKEFAIEGYELNVVDYLLKPFSFSRFLTAIQKIESKKEVAKEEDKEHFFVKSDKKLISIDSNDLMFLEAYGNYVKLTLKDKVVVCHQKLSFYDDFLANKGHFLRIHKSYIINEKYIELIEGNTIIIQNNALPIGQKYKKGVLEKLFI